MPSSTVTPPPEDPNKGWGVGGIENNVWLRVAYGVIATLGISGNLITCFVYLRVRELRTQTSYFISHLAMADIITLIWVIPFHLFPRMPPIPEGIAGEILCRVYISKFFLWVSIFSSIYSLLTVTMERFVAIVYPTKYKVLFTKRKCIGFCICTWMMGIVSNSYFLFNYHVSGDLECVIMAWPHRAYDILIGIYTLSAVYVVPLTTMLVAHYKMIVTLRSQARALKGRQQQNSGQANREDRREIWQLKASQMLVKTLLIVVITYALCWALNQSVFFAHNMGAPVDFSQPYYHVSVILATMNSCVNPFIYGFKNKHFQRGFKKAILCQKRTKINPGGTSQTESSIMSLQS